MNKRLKLENKLNICGLQQKWPGRVGSVPNVLFVADQDYWTEPFVMHFEKWGRLGAKTVCPLP